MLYDQTHCPGGECPSRIQCVRYRAKIYGRTDFFGSPPFDRRTSACDHLMPLASLTPSVDAIRTRAYHLWLAEGSPEGRAIDLWLHAERELSERALEGIAPESERP